MVGRFLLIFPLIIRHHVTSVISDEMSYELMQKRGTKVGGFLVPHSTHNTHISIETFLTLCLVWGQFFSRNIYPKARILNSFERHHENNNKSLISNPKVPILSLSGIIFKLFAVFIKNLILAWKCLILNFLRPRQWFLCFILNFFGKILCQSSPLGPTSPLATSDAESNR